MQLVRALEGELVMFFLSIYKKKKELRPPIAHSAMLEGKPRTINTGDGWSRSVKAKREFMKNKQITANVNQGQWSNYKHCCAFSRAVKKTGESRKKARARALKVWAMKERTQSQTSTLQGSFQKLQQLTTSERRMMSPHHSLVLPISLLVYVCAATKRWPQIPCLRLRGPKIYRVHVCTLHNARSNNEGKMRHIFKCQQ